MYVTLRDRPSGDQPPPLNRAVRRVATTVLLLGVVSMLTDISSEMVNAILPIYLTTEIGVGLISYGVIDGLYQGVSAVLRIGGGYAGDRGGHPKWVAAAGYLLSAVTRLAMIPVHGMAGISAVVTVDRLGKGMRTAPRDALIADVSEAAQLGRAFGVHRTLDTLGAAIGPLVAFGLLLAVPRGYDAIFVASFAFAVVGVAVIVLFVPDRRTGTGASRIPAKRILATLTQRRLRKPLIAAGLLGVFTVGDGFLYLSLQHRDEFATSLFPLLYVGTNIAYLVLALPLGRLADRIGRAKVLVGGHVALLAAYLAGAVPFGGPEWTVIVLLLLGTFYAATDGVLPALISQLLPAGIRGSGIAAAQTVVVVARLVSSLGFGVLWASTDRMPALLAVSVLLAAAIPVAAWLLRGVSAGGSVAEPADPVADPADPVAGDAP
jgi:MFS family permease